MQIPSELDLCTVTYLTIVYPMKCLVNQDDRTIKIYQSLASVAIPEGSTLSLKISPVTNPDTPQSVASFKLTSYTDWY